MREGMVEGIGSGNQHAQHSAFPVAVACHGCSPLQGARSHHVAMALGCSQPQEGARRPKVVMLRPGYVHLRSSLLVQVFTVMPKLARKEDA